MEHKKIIIAGALFFVIVAGMFVYTAMKKNELNKPAPSVATTTDTVSTPYSSITRIDAKHFFIDGTHTVAGEILMPTPCDLLNWDTRILNFKPEEAMIDFTVVNHADSCEQVVTPQRFKVSFSADENVIIKATLQGRPIEMNLIPALTGESPDDFELFIKG